MFDTWFSSALWPFATLGWPEQTRELEVYYPTDVDSTARDIIFLWVARMMMAGQELTGAMPFHDVIIHSLVLAPDGRRMSKSLGTGIEPDDVIDQYGADATRYGLLKMSSTQDVRFSQRVHRGGPEAREQALERGAADPRERRGRRAGHAAASLRGAVDDRPARRGPRGDHGLDRVVRVRRLAGALYRSTFDDFCDWYAEAIKPRLYERDAGRAARRRSPCSSACSPTSIR